MSIGCKNGPLIFALPMQECKWALYAHCSLIQEQLVGFESFGMLGTVIPRSMAANWMVAIVLTSEGGFKCSKPREGHHAFQLRRPLCIPYLKAYLSISLILDNHC